MKSVLISIQPKWVEKIASGEKTIEVRKTRPKLETPFKCYIYATKPKKYYKVSRFIATSDENLYLVNGKIKMDNGFAYWGDGVDYEYLNRKVIGEFVCDKITALYNVATTSWDLLYGDVHDHAKNLVRKACLTEKEIHDYAKGKDCYGWHITDLKIYDKPKELSEFKYHCKYEFDDDFKHCESCDYHYYSNNPSSGIEEYCTCDCLKTLTRPPQSWCYVESLGE